MIARQDVEEVLPLVRSYLEMGIAEAHGRTDIDHVIADLLAEKASLWIIYGLDKGLDAAVVTRVSNYPLKRMLLLELTGGQHMERWFERAVEVFRNFAIDSKLDGVEIYGRRGWSRALRRHGMRETIVVTEIDLKQGSENVQ